MNENYSTLVERVQECVGRVVIKNLTVYDFLVICKPVETIFIQFSQVLPCIKTGKTEIINGRKWYISKHMTDDEILRTLFAAYKMFCEHEINENFLVDGVRFLNPHPEGARP